MTPSPSSQSSPSSSSSSSAPPRGPPVAAPLSSAARYQALPQQATHDDDDEAPVVCDSAAAWEPDEMDLDIVMSLDSLDSSEDSLESPRTSPRSTVIHPVDPGDRPVDPVNAVGSVHASRLTQMPMTTPDCLGETTPSALDVRNGHSSANKPTTLAAATTRRFAATQNPHSCVSATRRWGTRGARYGAEKAAAGAFEDYQRLLHGYLPAQHLSEESQSLLRAYLPAGHVSEESLSLLRALHANTPGVAYLLPAPNPKRALASTAVASRSYYYYQSQLERASGESLESGTVCMGYNDVRSEPDFLLPVSFAAIGCRSPAKAHLLITTAATNTNAATDVIGTETTSGAAVANPNTTSNAAANPCTHSEDQQRILALQSSREEPRREITQRTPQLAEAQEEGAHNGRSNRREVMDGGGNSAASEECGEVERSKKRRVREAELDEMG
ncbi:unnamed protein product [Closterium sp. Yama58-4]|nr:unnamed protein product [Closterium sp. Yama58-4]